MRGADRVRRNARKGGARIISSMLEASDEYLLAE